MQGYREQGYGSTGDEADLVNIDFASEYSENFPKILQALGVSLVVSSYQSHAVMLLRSCGTALNCSVKKFVRPMGVCVSEDRLLVSTVNRIVNFKASSMSRKSVLSGEVDNIDSLASKLRDEQRDTDAFKALRTEQISAIKQCDVLFTERSSLTTGTLNTHDIAWGDDGLWVVNSSFSCLATLSSESGFTPRWKPHFISELKPQDRCHLNGMAMLDGQPRYVTTFNTQDYQDSWRTELNGTLMDVEKNEILISGLSMPHSPRCHDGKVYLCNSGEGEILCYDPKTCEKSVLCTLPGFTRGLTFYGDLMLVATSHVRSSTVVNDIPLTKAHTQKDTVCGIWIINKQNGEILSKLQFKGDVSQLYDLCIIPNSTFPEMISGDDAISAHLYEFTKEELK
ncbi:TIGR03032 family protein [Pseudoalteromonas luteoviolacea]|uniref:TIGR03032 family protein n=1 Tax=Pseudoalteromonas luteoviolacea TaxID=43657 RepID=UPI001EEEE716|nr:TIGR03032 family protein [Pseudoalteromonas luteoviolacea]MCF6442703.1 TIGR03032 family protein [Pseudoalteromonas luteoviolacea]